MNHNSTFLRLARWASHVTGHPMAFGLAVAVVLVWAATGRLFNFSDTWQLVINTGTTIVTFLMVFLIQNSQNRDTEAVHIKLDELIRAMEGAHNTLLGLEKKGEEEFEQARARYEELARRAEEMKQQGLPDTDTPKVKD